MTTLQPRYIALISVFLALACDDSQGRVVSTMPVDGAAPWADASAEMQDLPTDKLADVLETLRVMSGAPGAVLGVSQRGQRWSGAAGIDDLNEGSKMLATRRFRAGSITKMFTGVAAMRLVETGKLRLDDRLSRWFPGFPNAGEITVDMLLSHTAGVSATWWEDPQFLAYTTRDLSRNFSPREVIERVAMLPPAGAPGSSFAYSNAGFILLGEVAAQSASTDIAALIRSEVIQRSNLSETTYQFDNPPDLAHGYFEYEGSVFDASGVAQQSFVSFGGAAAAVHSTVGDLTHFLEALFASEHLVSASSRAHMMDEAVDESALGRGLMAFCPCTDGPDGRSYAGYGHGGHLPGYWALAVYYPSKELAVAMMINRDSVAGTPIDRSSLDRAALAVFEAIP